MKISAKTALCVSVIISFAFVACLLISSLFTEGSGVQIKYRHVSEKALMTGRDDPDSMHVELLPGEQLDINQADVLELQQLPGIGEKLSERIVEHRQSKGPFRSTEDILQVDGIGKGSFELIEDSIFVGEYDENSGS